VTGQSVTARSVTAQEVATQRTATPGTATPGTVVGGIDGRRVACEVAMVSALVAALAHVWVIPEHLAEWPLAALFFAVVALAQLLLAVSLRRSPSPLVVGLGLAGTVGIIIFYVTTRTVDLPFLPLAHDMAHLPTAWGVGNGIPIFPGARIEEVGVPDLVCLGAELVTVLALCSLAGPAVRRVATTGLCALGVAMLVLRLTGVLG
jgi:hypothetical protein